MAKTGPKPKEINWGEFEAHCHHHGTQEEIASCMGMDIDTLVRRVEEQYGEKYSVVYKRLTNTGKRSLRSIQFEQAKKNAAMAIWLGKNWLEQREPEPIIKDDALAAIKQFNNNVDEHLKAKPVDNPQ